MVPLRKAIQLTGLAANTLRKYADNGYIHSIRTPAGQRLFDIEGWLKTGAQASVVCYARVSSHKQRDDLARQVERLAGVSPEAEIIKDIGSGLNFKRKGLQTLLERLLRGDKLKVVVTHRDRLARFGIEAIRFLITKNGGELVVLDPYVGSAEAELTTDLLAILHHFSCRMHGMRAYHCKEDPDLPLSRAKDDLQALVRSLTLCLQQNGGDLERPEGESPEALDDSGEIDIS